MSIKKIPAKPERATSSSTTAGAAQRARPNTLSGHAGLRAPSASRPLPPKGTLASKTQPPFQPKEPPDELELVFDELAEEAEITIEGGHSDSDAAAVRETFRDISAERMAAVHTLMSEVHGGHVPAEWFQTCLPVVRSVLKAAEEVEEPGVLDALRKFTGALDKAANAGSLSPANAQALVGAYGPISTAFPSAQGAIDRDRERREPLVVLGLLEQIDGISFLGQSRLFEAGLNRLETLSKVQAAELASVTGLADGVANEVASIFKQYVQQHGLTTSTLKPDVERRELAKLVDDLARTQERFEQASAKWSKSAIEEKRRRRREREVKFARVQVALARLGAVQLIGELQRVSFDRRVSSLRAFASGGARTPQ